LYIALFGLWPLLFSFIINNFSLSGLDQYFDFELNSALLIAGIFLLLLPVKKLKAYDKHISAPPQTADELDKLFALKQKGAITEDEYETRKQQLLKS